MTSLTSLGRLLAALLLSLGALADTVTLADGSTLKGTVLGAQQGKLSLQTSFAGTLSIELAQIKAITTDEECFIELASGSTLRGKLTGDGQRQAASTFNGPVDISRDQVAAVWRPGEANPREVKLQEEIAKAKGSWKYEAALDLSGKSGNTDREAYGGAFSATLVRPDDRLKFYIGGERVKDNDVESTDQLKGGIDYERSFAERHSWYIREELEKNEIRDLKLRSTTAFGYGYHFIKREDRELRGRIGLLYRYEDYFSTGSQDGMGLDLGLKHRWRFSKWASMTNDLTYEPSFEDPADYRAFHESGLELPLGADLWKLRLGISHDYTSQPPGDQEKLDTAWFLRLVLSWD